MLEASGILERDRLEKGRDFCFVNPVPLMTNNICPKVRNDGLLMRRFTVYCL